MLERLKDMRGAAEAEITRAASIEELGEIRVRYLGKKGELTAVLRGMGALPPDERPRVGALANSTRQAIEELLRQRGEELKRQETRKRLLEDTVDVTLPGRPVTVGRVHPLKLVQGEIERIFLNMGYDVVEGPEVEFDYYNFEALNIPRDHPARDMQDSFYLGPDVLLRTQTSPVQIRTMERTAPRVPVRIIAPGRVYRRDDDATHSPMFHQVEGLVVDEGITMGDLKGTLISFAREMFGEDREIRLRPSYFPFTEPSAEVDVSCIICGGEGCRVCNWGGWLEILGSGMVHPQVLRNGGYDPEKVSGFAFGMGIERITMLKYGIDDLRTFFQNDMRFLEQF